MIQSKSAPSIDDAVLEAERVWDASESCALIGGTDCGREVDAVLGEQARLGEAGQAT
jgi:hypothetical protein